MRDNECDGPCVPTGDIFSTKPLRVITHYSSEGADCTQSLGRPSTLGVCTDASQRTLGFKLCRERGSELDMLAQHWSAKNADNFEFERILGQLGNNNSTPVTPTSFLNPRNITEDQEMFADNFSRTLNKLKAEQEGWISSTSVESETTTRSLMSTSRLTTPCFLDSYASVSSRSVPPLMLTTDTNDHEIQSDKPDLSDSVISRISTLSPPSTTTPIMLPSKVLRPDKSPPSHRRSLSSTRNSTSRSSAHGCTTLPTASPSTWSGSLQLPMRTATSVVTSGLPTILTIATSLKEGRNEFRPDGTRVSDTHSNGLFSIPVQNGRSYSSFAESTSTFISGGTDPSTAITRYAISDTGFTSAASTSGSLLASLISVSSSGPSRCSIATDSTPEFRPREIPNDVYAVLRPDMSSASGFEILPPLLTPSTGTVCSLPVSTASELTSLSSSMGPLTLLIGRSPTLASVEARIEKRSSSGSRLASSIALPEATSGFLLSQGAQLQHLSALYPGLTNTFAVSTGGHINGLMNESSPFLLQPTTDGLSFIPALSVSSPSTTPLGADLQPIRSLQSAGLAQNGVQQILCPQSVTVSANSSTSDVGSVLSRLPSYQPTSMSTVPYASSKASQAEPTLSPMVHPTTTTPTSIVSAHATGKKSRRYNSSANRRGRSSTVLTVEPVCETSSSIVSADSSSDVLSYAASVAHTNGSQTCSKRSKRPIDAFTANSVTLCTAELLGGAYSNGATALVYVPEPLRSVMIKSEPLQSDSASNHSESFSAETGLTLQGNTPPSSLDGLGQSNLKLERKRARNRVAARRCRERKLSLIRALECQVAERDAQLKDLEDLLSRYRSEGERLRAHMEYLADSYPSLKAELCQFPFLFQQHNTHTTEQSRLTGPSAPSHTDCVASKHFS